VAKRQIEQSPQRGTESKILGRLKGISVRAPNDCKVRNVSGEKESKKSFCCWERHQDSTQSSWQSERRAAVREKGGYFLKDEGLHIIYLKDSELRKKNVTG